MMKELMVIVFFNVEKAYDSMWREGLLIKMNRKGIGGKFIIGCENACQTENSRLKLDRKYQMYLRY